MKNSVFILVTVFSVLFAFFVLIQRELLKSGIHPLYLNTLIYVVAAGIFILYSLVRQPDVLRIKSKKGMVLGIISATLASVFADVLVLFGLQTGSPITWSIFVGIIPLMTYLFAVLFISEQFFVKKLMAILFAIGGTVLMLYTPGTGIDLTHGTLYFIVAVIAFACANITNQRTLSYLSTGQFTFLRLTSAAIVLTILVVVTRPAFVGINWLFLLTNSTILVVAIELVNRVMQKTSASYFSVTSNMGTLFLILLSVVLFAEWPTILQVGGGAVVIGSIFLFQSVRVRRLKNK